MGLMRIEHRQGAEAREVFLYQGALRLQEVFGVSEDLSEQALRSLGYIPLEDLFPGQFIEGYAELGETLYATTWE